MTWREWLIVALGVPLLALLIVSWVALWRGWRSGRLLYTMITAVGVLSLPLLGPSAKSGLTQLFDSSTTLVEGAILGLLYFSELRHRYGSSVDRQVSVGY